MATNKGKENSAGTQKPPELSPDAGEKLSVIPSGPRLSVRVFKVLPGAKKATPEARCTVGSFATFKNESLGYLRKYLNSQKTLNSIDSGLPFCTPDGARVEEKTTFSEYANLVQETDNSGTAGQEDDATATKAAHEAAKDDASGTTGTHEPATGLHKSDELSTCNVYLLERNSQVQLSDPVKKFLDSVLDTSISGNGELPTAELKRLKSSYNHAPWSAEVSKGEKTYAAEMSEDEWAIVMQNNDLLHGLRIIPARAPDNKLALNGIDRSFLPAFTLKPRSVEFYKRAPGVELDTTAEYAVPRFRIQDDSYVRMTEAKSDIESSFASSSLTQHDVQAAVGGSAFGWDASAKFGLTKRDEGKYAQASQTSTEMMHISYNFPRVVLRLDGDSLELDPCCRSRLEKVTDFSSMSAFFNDYGQFFATQVQLGGRLQAAEDVKATAESTKEDKVNALKFAAGVSFSGPTAQGSVSYSRESKSATANTEQKASFNKSMTWEAQGGDTLLCNSPPDWCPTVNSFYNWRTIKQENLVFLPDLIGKLPACQDYPLKFKRIAENAKSGKTGGNIVPYLVDFTLELEGSGGEDLSLDTNAPGAHGASITVMDEEAMSGSNTSTYFLEQVYKHWRDVKAEMGGLSVNFLSFNTPHDIINNGKSLYKKTWRFEGESNEVRRVASRKATQAARQFRIRTQNNEGVKLARRGQQYQFDIPGESMSLAATSNLPGYVPQSYLFAGDFQTRPQTPVKFAFWDTELAEYDQVGGIPDGAVVNLVAWVPNSTKPGFVCLRKDSPRTGTDFEVLPGQPDLSKIARFKIKYGKVSEAPLSAEEKRGTEEEAQRLAEEKKHPAEEKDHLEKERKSVEEANRRLEEANRRLEEVNRRLEKEKDRAVEEAQRLAEEKRHHAEVDKHRDAERKSLEKERRRLEEENRRLEKEKRQAEEDRRLAEEMYWTKEKQRLDEEEKSVTEEKDRLVEEKKPLDEVNLRLIEINQRRAEEKWPVNTYPHFDVEGWYAIQTVGRKMCVFDEATHVSLSAHYDQRSTWRLYQMAPNSNRYLIRSLTGYAISSDIRSGLVKDVVYPKPPTTLTLRMGLSWLINKDPSDADGNIHTIRSATYPTSVLTCVDNQLRLVPDGDGKWDVNRRPR